MVLEQFVLVEPRHELAMLLSILYHVLENHAMDLTIGVRYRS